MNKSTRCVAVLILSVGLATFLSAADLEEKTYDAGATVGLWTAGDIDVEGFDAEKESSLLFHLFYDYYLMPELAMGIFLNFAPDVVVEGADGEAFTEFGFSIIPRFFVSESLAIKPGLQMGYRTSEVAGEDLEALGLNLNCQFYYLPDPAKKIAYIGEIGFLAQPAGGTDSYEITFGPIFYLSAGVSL